MAGLESSQLFSGLNAAELAALREAAVLKEFPAGGTIFQEGDEGDGIYVVGEGQVQISALVGQGERRVLDRVGPGCFFGEMAVLDREPRSASATAELESKLYFIAREELLKMIKKSPTLTVSLLREFSLRMRDFNRHYIQEVLQAERLTLVGRFARSIVHDFKNPLNIIALAAEFVNMEKASPEMRGSASGRIQKQVERLTNMCNELLEFTRGSQQAVVLSAIDYGSYLRPLLDELSQDLREKGVKIVYENEPPNQAVLMDGKRLMHVFTNLIYNAVDAMPAGGEIILRFELNGREVLTEIEDTGTGLAPEILPNLFEAFATFGKSKGTGLGLSICKRIIEDHKGSINARNEPGRGAIFSFTLPTAAT